MRRYVEKKNGGIIIKGKKHTQSLCFRWKESEVLSFFRLQLLSLELCRFVENRCLLPFRLYAVLAIMF